jgi:type III pantothenate kinase
MSVVVDVGNTRIKWGLCAAGRVVAMAGLPHDDEAAWQRQLASWNIAADPPWTLGGVDPGQCDRLHAWLERHGYSVRVIDSYRQLPLKVQVDAPDKVGLDRLFNAVAANTVRPSGHGAIVIDAGTAVTVNLIDADGAFRGGAILPGLRLMADALHRHTAQLPLVHVDRPVMPPGRNTDDAMKAGVFHAVLGGIELLRRRLVQHVAAPCSVFCTGGDAPLIAPQLEGEVRLWPEMTLEGIRDSASNVG